MAIRWEKLPSNRSNEEQAQPGNRTGKSRVLPVHLLLHHRGPEGVIPSVLARLVPRTLETELHQSKRNCRRVAGAATQPGVSQALNKFWTRPSARLRTSRTNTSRRASAVGVAHGRMKLARGLVAWRDARTILKALTAVRGTQRVTTRIRR